MSWFHFKFDDFSVAFLSVLFEGVPFLLLGSLISGIVDVFVSPERLAKTLPKNPVVAVLVSGLLGLIFPMCECGNVIVIRRFIRKGLPLSYAVTYMLASPIVSPLVALSTFAAFRGQHPLQVMLLRLSMGYVIAIAAGFIVRRFQPQDLLQPGLVGEPARKRGGLGFAVAPADRADAGPRDFAELGQGAGFWRKILLGLHSATSDFLDVAFFFIVGIATASVFNTAVRQDLVIGPFATTPILGILGLMFLAAILAICSNTDAFVAASFASFALSAKLAFMVFDAMFNVKLFWLYGLLFKRKVVIILSLGLAFIVAFMCWRLSTIIDHQDDAGQVQPPFAQSLSSR